MAVINKSLSDNTAAMNKKVEDNFKDINDRVNKSLQDGFKGNSDTMGELKKQLGAIDDAQKHLQSLQDDVTSLNQVLQGNQTRGAYGELQLSMLLENTFPNGKGKYYNLQDDLGFTKGDEKQGSSSSSRLATKRSDAGSVGQIECGPRRGQMSNIQSPCVSARGPNFGVFSHACRCPKQF